jgi:hypothetical protein
MGYKYINIDLTTLPNGNSKIAQPPHGKIWKIKEIFGKITSTSNANAEIHLRKFIITGDNHYFKSINISSNSTSCFYIGQYITTCSIANLVYSELILTEFDYLAIEIIPVSPPASPSFINILIEEVDA